MDGTREGAAASGGAGVELAARERIAADTAAARKLPREVVLALLEVLQRPWSSLALVPTAVGPWPFLMAEALAELGLAFRLGPVRAVTAVAASLPDGERIRDAIIQHVENGERVVVAVDPPDRNAAAVTTLMAAEAILLVVQLGTTALEPLDEIVRVVGRDRILGSIAVHPGVAERR